MPRSFSQEPGHHGVWDWISVLLMHRLVCSHTQLLREKKCSSRFFPIHLSVQGTPWGIIYKECCLLFLFSNNTWEYIKYKANNTLNRESLRSYKKKSVPSTLNIKDHTLFRSLLADLPVYSISFTHHQRF